MDADTGTVRLVEKDEVSVGTDLPEVVTSNAEMSAGWATCTVTRSSRLVSGMFCPLTSTVLTVTPSLVESPMRMCSIGDVCNPP
jgi:hypothetical protein